MLRDKAFILIAILFSLNIVASVEIATCGVKGVEWRCLLGEICKCEIEGCNQGNLLVFYRDITNPLCFPPIKDGTASIDLVECGVEKDRINVTAICNGEQSSSKQITILLEKPPACIWNETANSCSKNPDPLAEKCGPGYFCAAINETCVCKKITTTIATTSIPVTTATATTTQATTEYVTTTTSKLRPCPYECCEGIKGYEDMLCDEGYVCCEENGRYICKKGKTCMEKKASGFSGWIVIILILALSIIGGAVYYFSKSKVSLQDKYRF